jgi:hypothetical protein
MERVVLREEKKQIVMLATAMLDDSHSADKQIAFNLGKLEMVADLSHTLEGLGHCVRSELVSHKNIDDVIAPPNTNHQTSNINQITINT